MAAEKGSQPEPAPSPSPESRVEASEPGLAADEVSILTEAILATVRHPLIVLDADLRVRTANPAFYQTFQVSSEQTLNHPLFELGNGNWNIPNLRTLLEEVLPKNHFLTDLEVEHAFEKLGVRTMVLNARALVREGSRPDLILLGIEDVTERNRAEQALRDARDYAENIVETVREPLLILDPSLRVRSANGSFYRTFQLNPSETQGRFLYELAEREWDIPQLRDLLENVLPMDTAFSDFEVEHHFKLLGHRTMLLNARRVDDVHLILLAIEDITERRQAEDATRRLAAIIDSTQDAVIGATLEGTVTSWNAGAEMLYGYSAAEMLGKPLALLAPPDLMHEMRVILERIMQGHRIDHFMTCQVQKSGRRIDVSVSVSPIKDASGQVVGAAAIARDITESLKMSEALRSSRERTSAIFNTADDAIITIDERGIIESANPATERIFGYSAAELIGQNVSMLMTLPDREEHDAYLARYLKTGEKRIIGTRREVQGRRKDGSIFPLELAVSEFQVGGQRHFAGVHRDIARRKALEREVIEIAAEEQRRIGQDLHDGIGQELTGLGLTSEALAEALREQESPEAELATRVASGLRHVLGQVRMLARGLIPVHVHAQGLMIALEELAARVREQSGIACAFACDKPVLLDDGATATHLYRIAQEAVTNAVRHGNAQNITITLASEDTRIVLRVRDDGIGIRLPQGEGKGLGLRIMHYRAGLIGAALDIASAERGGTVVTCLLNKDRTDVSA